jgi:hypothetical protein
LKYHRERDIKLYIKQRNKVNNMNKIANEHFENNLDYILLENSSNPKTYWKIMKMLIKSNKGSNCIPPLRNSINDENFDDIVYGVRIVIIFVGIHSCVIFRKHFVNFSHISSMSFKWSSFSFQLISFNFSSNFS